MSAPVDLSSLFRAWTVKDLSALPCRTDPEVCGIETEGNYLVLRWGGGAYDIDLDDIKNPEDLLWSILHLSHKAWPGMTAQKIGALILIVARAKGWEAYSPLGHRNEAPAPQAHVLAERAKMTPDMRYEVIRRDAYRCRACGSSVASGAVLHVDHIKPVSKGGKTEMGNLQTLCGVCNFGKNAK